MMRKLLALILILVSIPLFFYVKASKMPNVFLIIPRGDGFRELRNSVYNAVYLFKKECFRQNFNLVLDEVDDVATIFSAIKKLKPVVIISVLHKPKLVEFLEKWGEPPVPLINIFPYYKHPDVLNMSVSLSDQTKYLVEFLKARRIESVKIILGKSHIDKAAYRYISEAFKEAGINLGGGEFIIIVKTSPIEASDDIERLSGISMESSSLIFSVNTEEYYFLFGKSMMKFFGVFPMYMPTKRGKEFVRLYKEVFGGLPDWTVVSTYDSLTFVSSHLLGDKLEIPKEYEGVGGIYGFSMEERLFEIKRFEEVFGGDPYAKF